MQETENFAKLTIKKIEPPLKLSSRDKTSILEGFPVAISRCQNVKQKKS